MTTASFQFLGFVLLVAVIYNALKSIASRQVFFLCTNLYFLSTFSQGVRSYFPFVAFLALGFVGVRLMKNNRGRRAFVPLLVTVVLAFVWLKKYTFLPTSSFIGFPYLTIGLSYVFFRLLHLIIDAHDANLPEISLLGYLNYTLNFTTLISGPIQWYQEFAEQQLSPDQPLLDVIVAGEALERIVIGFFKVTVLSSVLFVIRARALSALPSLDSFWLRVATGSTIAVVYPIYLYFNFSGYTDIVIGAARFLRLQLPENFNRPFSSLNFIDFWGRWHMTLSTWLKTYVYTAVVKALMKRFPSPGVEPFLGVFAFFVTFFLIGVWHGQTSVFVAYGVLLGFGVAVDKLYQVLMVKAWGRKEYKRLASNATYRACARGLTFTWFTFSLFWFWSDWSQMASISRAMGRPALLAMWISIFLGATVILSLWEAAREWTLSFQWNGSPLLTSRYVRTVWDTALATISTAVVLLNNTPAPDIVYKRF
jgi:D-alanyl-lipoteichoic acid acyltransferase DltB (MBOAT superfamily)